MKKTKILAFVLTVIMVLSMVSVFASAAFELTTSSELTSMKNAGTLAYSLVRNYEASDYKVDLLHDGTNGNCYIYVFDGKATKLQNADGVTTRKNVFWDENEKAILLTKYDTVRQQVTYKGVNFESTVRSVAIDGNHAETYTAGKEVYLNADMTAFVEAGTDGALSAYVTAKATYSSSKGKTTVSVAVGETYAIYDAETKTLTPAKKGDAGAVAVAAYSDDNNNGVYSSTKYSSGNATKGDVLNYVYVNIITIKHVKGQPVNNVFNTIPSADCKWATGGIEADGTFFYGKNKTVVAELQSDRYYNLAHVLYAEKVGNNGTDDLYTWFYDIYVDGIKAATGEVGPNYVGKTATEIAALTKYGYEFSTKVTGSTEKASEGTNEDKPAAYVKNIQIYAGPKDKFTYGNYVNSGNTVEGYDLTVNGGTLGLNYYLNFTGDVLADSTATVDFAIADGKTVSLKVADAEEVAGKGYKFTVPVSSAQMAKKITMTVNGKGTYYVYKNGTASTSYEYSVKEYADAVIASGATSENDKALAAAMLNYGAYAQKYFDYDAQNLPVATPDVSKVTDNDISAVTISGTAPTGTKAALVLDSDITIVIYDKDGNKIGEEKGITSLNLDKSYTITCEGDKTVTVSVLAIGEKVLESNATSENYKNLIKALKLFADASKPFAAQ